MMMPIRLCLVAGLLYLWHLVDARVHGVEPRLSWSAFAVVAAAFVVGYLCGANGRREHSERPYVRIVMGLLAGAAGALVGLVFGLVIQSIRAIGGEGLSAGLFLLGLGWHVAVGLLIAFI
jgi:hypothetical protein